MAISQLQKKKKKKNETAFIRFMHGAAGWLLTAFVDIMACTAGKSYLQSFVCHLLYLGNLHEMKTQPVQQMVQKNIKCHDIGPVWQ